MNFNTENSPLHSDELDEFLADTASTMADAMGEEEEILTDEELKQLLAESEEFHGKIEQNISDREAFDRDYFNYISEME